LQCADLIPAGGFNGFISHVRPPPAVLDLIQDLVPTRARLVERDPGSSPGMRCSGPDIPSAVLGEG
ncbi:MAG: hypothetical protein AAF562_00630, partial [Pseudomonadota bacterium]